MRRLALLLVAGFAAGCASSSTGTGDDARRDDAAADLDAGIDAPVDAPAARPGREVVSSGGRIRAGSITMDVEIGHPVEQSKATAGSITLRGAAVVNP
ncbi:MAG TPA: hypothetical protein VM261_22920 [Kofleriaceae bacterium]|nr:hypothetical protein [Kofleriaceae bacterium]